MYVLENDKENTFGKMAVSFRVGNVQPKANYLIYVTNLIKMIHIHTPKKN